MKEKCPMPGCNAVVHCRGMCDRHYRRLLIYGSPYITKVNPPGIGTRKKDGSVAYMINGRYVYESILIAEKILGKKLPVGAQVHHFNGDRSNNKHDNLIICENGAYHALLHRRQRAKKACGHVDWIRCSPCKKHFPPEEISIYKILGGYHERISL